MKLISILAAAALAPALSIAGPARILIVTGQSDTQYHDWRVTTPFLKGILDRTGRFDVRVTEEPNALTRDALTGYDAVVLNYNGPRWGRQAETALEEFVRSGKGLVSLHGVTYGPLMGTAQKPGGGWNIVEPWAAYVEMLGVSWDAKNIGHAARHAFTVKLSDTAHPIVRGVERAFQVNDELYHRMSHKPGIRVLATAFDDPARGGTGKDEPVAWTVAYGKGRAFHCTLGHDTNAMYSVPSMTMFARAVEWAATGEVAQQQPAQLSEREPKDAPRVLVVTGGHAYETSFYGLFEGLRWSHATSQKEAFRPGMNDRYDVVVLYDMYNDIGEAERKALRGFVEAGKGVVSLHHAIVDYTSWPWWHEEAIGGKYFEKPEAGHAASRYKDDVPMVVRPAKGKESHPIVRGLGEIVTVDECYKGMWHAPGITVLMETENEFNDRPVVYLGPRPNSRVVYIQLGHGAYTHNHPGFRRLVKQAVYWAAGK